jgi:hypothetical protein
LISLLSNTMFSSNGTKRLQITNRGIKTPKDHP